LNVRILHLLYLMLMEQVYRPLTAYDFLLFPFYLLLVIFIAKKIKNRYGSQLQTYFKLGLTFKIILVVVFTLLSNYVMRGDSVDLYFREGKNFANIISHDPSNIKLLFTQGSDEIDELATPEEKGYLAKESNYMVVKVSAFVCFFTFSKFLLVNLFVGFLAFLGSWRLFLFFREIMPCKDKWLAVACFGIPTVVFWSAGINKDSLCMASIGFMTKAIFDIAKNRRILLNTLISIIAIYMVFQIKLYIILSYMPFFLFFILMYAINRARSRSKRLLLKLSVPIVFLITIVYIYINSNDLFKKFSAEALLESVSKVQSVFIAQGNAFEGSYFSLGKEFDGTISGLIKLAPKAMEATFFRPYIWESRNIIMLFSSLENLIILVFAIITLLGFRKMYRFLKSILSNPLVIYCLGFAILFAVFVGVTSLNFGTLVRYKIPCIPFFVIALIYINQFTKPVKAPAK
jgi:hypothetical protein